MYTNILIPTDGSELAGKAVQHGIALAKRIGAKATVLTVLTPFHTLTIDTQMIEDTQGTSFGKSEEALGEVEADWVVVDHGHALALACQHRRKVASATSEKQDTVRVA